MKIDVISDPGHAWAKVFLPNVVRLGIAHKISNFSYVLGSWAYLEEDRDMPIYTNTLRKLGHSLSFNEIYVDSFDRSNKWNWKDEPVQRAIREIEEVINTARDFTWHFEVTTHYDNGVQDNFSWIKLKNSVEFEYRLESVIQRSKRVRDFLIDKVKELTFEAYELVEPNAAEINKDDILFYIRAYPDGRWSLIIYSMESDTMQETALQNGGIVEEAKSEASYYLGFKQD